LPHQVSATFWERWRWAAVAFAGMIALASPGFAVVLKTSEVLFYAVKILGAAYLFYLAYQLWRANQQAEAETAVVKVTFGRWRGKRLWRRPARLMMGNKKDSERVLSAISCHS